jgi:N-acetyl-alpha-D-muramate 1-phosphate uridylyltransferase
VTDLRAIVLAAGEGRRLRPLTGRVPKALCPVGNVPLLDRALARVAALGLDAAVNACYLGDQVVAHVGTRAHVAVEPGDPWGTSGGVARLRDWLDGCGALVGNADAYLADAARPPGDDIAALVEGWDGETVRILGVPGGDEFSGHRFAGFSLLPWRVVRDLPVERSELVRTAWRPAERAGRLAVVPYAGTYLDTGTPRTYLAANLHAAGAAGAGAGGLIDPTAVVTGTAERAVVGARATVRGHVREAVVWPDAEVPAGETLHRAIRAPGLTVDAA